MVDGSMSLPKCRVPKHPQVSRKLEVYTVKQMEISTEYGSMLLKSKDFSKPVCQEQGLRRQARGQV